jgi:hypothetical protein
MMSAKSTTASVANKVAVISLFFKLPRPDINAFLALLCNLGHDVPKDAKTILQTTRFL